MDNKKSKMTIEEAIEVLNNMYPKTCKMVNGRLKGGYNDMESPQGKAIQVAVEVLKKQIPKQPIVEIEKDWEGNICDDIYRCPVCLKPICFGVEGNLEENYPYCNCGQKLDWSDTE